MIVPSKQCLSQLGDIRRKTRAKFKHLKVRCANCVETDCLEFHHFSPPKVDEFLILCPKCHRNDNKAKRFKEVNRLVEALNLRYSGDKSKTG